MDGQDIKEKAPKIEEGQGIIAMLILQRELLEEYTRIEKLPVPVWDLRLKENQILLKGFLARIVEELGEAYESLLEEDWANFRIELADATHFLLETMIVSGVSITHLKIPNMLKEDINTFPYSLKDAVTNWFWETTFQIQMARNALRNKEWKETHVMPDETVFHEIMLEVTRVFFKGFNRVAYFENEKDEKPIRMGEMDIYEEYWKKNQINKFRIRSKY